MPWWRKNNREPLLPPACQPCRRETCQLDVKAVRLNKTFSDNHVLRNFELEVRHGETFVIIGRSGCGKSVFLKHIVGLLQPDSGTMCVLGNDVSALSGHELIDLHRRVGMVFQHSALLASLSVRDNIGLGLSERGVSDEEIDRIAVEKLGLVDLENVEHLMPAELSGGMKKRVAVARTLAMNPELILYDEPTAGLDPVTCDDVDDLMVSMKERVGISSIVVTHDMVTAFRVADRIGMMHEGHIIQVGTPAEIRNSKDRVVQEFIARNTSREVPSS